MYKSLLAALFLTVGCAIASVAQNQKLSTSSAKAERLYEKADEYMRSRDFERALQALSEAIEKDPKFVEAYIRSANLQKMMGNKVAVYDLLQKGLQLVPYKPAYGGYYFDLADLQFERGEYAAAKGIYEAYLKSRPKNPKLIDWSRKQVKTAE